MEQKTLRCHFANQSSEGFVTVQALPKSRRVAKGFKYLASLWGLALLSVLVPVLHFVLVPLFLLIGLILGILGAMTTSEILDGEFICPSCANSNKFTPQSGAFPQDTRCLNCSNLIRFKATS